LRSSPAVATTGQAKMPGLVAELGELGLNSTFLDGEIVVLGANGAPDFNALQNAFDRRKAPIGSFTSSSTRPSSKGLTFAKCH
jgi:ATP-dependent DNA ligase